MTAAITMTDPVVPVRSISSQLMLQAWLSPSYPVGAYAYSHALETAVENNNVQNRESLMTWLEDNLRFGSGWNDAVFMAETARVIAQGPGNNDTTALCDLAALASAMSATSELQQETSQQGASFLKVTCEAWPHPSLEEFANSVKQTPVYPVCFAAAASWHGIDIRTAISGFLFAMTSNWISAAIRLNVIGQTDGQRLARASANLVENLAGQAVTSALDDLGGCCFLNDIFSFQHETQQARIFRS
jgi:urease accessory protein